MKNCLPLLDMFAGGPQTVYRDGVTTFRDGHIVYEPIKPMEIRSPLELVNAAFLFHGMSHVQSCVGNFLRRNPVFLHWRRCMPSTMPQALWLYQNRNVSFEDVDAAIKEIGVVLSSGQVIYHGGDLLSGLLTRPLSTTLDPSVAIAEALHKGKANVCGSVNVYILQVAVPRTCVYIYNQSRGNLAHEKEVLFASDARIYVDPNYTEVPFHDIPGRIFNAQIL